MAGERAEPAEALPAEAEERAEEAHRKGTAPLAGMASRRESAAAAAASGAPERKTLRRQRVSEPQISARQEEGLSRNGGCALRCGCLREHLFPRSAKQPGSRAMRSSFLQRPSEARPRMMSSLWLPVDHPRRYAPHRLPPAKKPPPEKRGRKQKRRLPLFPGRCFGTTPRSLRHVPARLSFCVDHSSLRP